MSIGAALHNALSGLTATSRAADIVSQNVANALTDGYGRRGLELSSRALGGSGAGVQVDGVTRSVSRTLLSERRLADAGDARTGTITDFHTRVEASIGLPGEPGALGTRYQALEAALVEAAGRPDLDQRLQSVASAASALAATMRDLGRTLQEERMTADREISLEVERMNTALGRIAELNRDIRIGLASGHDATALMDERQRVIDQVSRIIPVREIPRDHEQVALYTTGGAVLLDGRPAEVGFRSTATITADMTIASGALSGLTLNGQPVSAAASAGMLGGGSLGALFTVRDELAPDAQRRLDGLARDLIERFEDPAADPTRLAGTPGLFTDGGLNFDPLNEAGLAGRIAVNELVLPSAGGALWRLRSGLGAAATGDSGQAAGLLALSDALIAGRAPASGGFGPVPRGAGELAADLLSAIGGARQAAEGERAFTTARLETLKTAELAEGVDTDAELQRLLLIEKAYAANARIVTATEAMLGALLEM